MDVIFSVLIFLIIIGAVLYVVNLLPIDATIKQVIWVIVIVLVLIMVLQMLMGASHGSVWPLWPRMQR